MRLPTAASLFTLANAASITLYLPTHSKAPNPFSLPPTTHATLTSHGAYLSAPLTAVNTFVFRNVSEGSYLADVHCPTDGFVPLRIDVSAAAEDAPAAAAGKTEAVQAWETYRGNDWNNKGEALAVRDSADGSVGFEVRALGGKTYFMERPKFSVLSILMNPMILMGLVSMVLFIGMPKLVENMDPEMRAEFEASQKKSPMNSLLSGGGGGGQQAENPLGNFDMAAYLAGSNKKESGSAAAGESGAKAKGQGVRR